MQASTIAELFNPELLAPEFLYALAPRDGAILSHPVFMHKTGAPGTLTVNVPIIGYGANKMSPHTPLSEVSNTALSLDEVTVVLAAQTLRRSTTDIARYLAPGKLGAQAWAMDLAIAYVQTWIDLVANVGDDFTTTAGPGTGNAATWATLLAAKGALGLANATGGLLACLHTQQWNDLEQDALTLGYQASQTNIGVADQGLDSYKGNWFGIDVFAIDHTPTANAGADFAGCLLSAGAVVSADAELNDEADPNIVNLGRARLERIRIGGKLMTDFVESAMMGVSKGRDGSGVTYISRVTP